MRPSFGSQKECAGAFIVKNGMTTSNTSSAMVEVKPCSVAAAGGEDTSSTIGAPEPCSVATAGGEDTSSTIIAVRACSVAIAGGDVACSVAVLDEDVACSVVVLFSRKPAAWSSTVAAAMNDQGGLSIC